MEKPTPEQAAWVMEKIFESLDGGYSFRGMIYNALGYDDPESYSLFFNAGGMSLTNMHIWYEEFRELSLALEIATKAHKGQVDKAGHPYIAHPVIVASMVEGDSYDDYLVRVAANPIAREVKIADMQHNSDLSRIPYPTEKDLERVERYKVSIEKLNQG